MRVCMSRRLNCWLVAMWFWLHTHGKMYAWVRRSHMLKGLVPHFGYAEPGNRYRHIRTVEYVPVKNRRCTKNGDWVICFPGTYRVIHYRVVKISRWATKEEAERDVAP